MSAYPIPSNAGAWWLVSGKVRCLHAVAGAAATIPQMHRAINDNRPIPARAACGLRRRWWYPGVASRLMRRRCTACCLALGIDPGCGTPVNEASIRERRDAEDAG